MFDIEQQETYKIKGCLHKSGLFGRGVDKIVARTISDKIEKIKYKVEVDGRLYVLDIAKFDSGRENLSHGTVIQKYLSNHDMAALPFYVDLKGDFILSEYLDNFDSIDNIDIKDQDVDGILTQFTEMENILKSQVSEKNTTLRKDLLDDDFKNNLQKFVEDRLISEEDKETVINYINTMDEFNVPLVMKHSDIQPGNILFNKETGKVKLIDFEFAGYGGEMYDWACFYNTMPDVYKEKIDKSILNNAQFIFFDFDFNIRRLYFDKRRLGSILSKMEVEKQNGNYSNVEDYKKELDELKSRIEKATIGYKMALEKIKATPAVVKTV